MLNQVLKVSSGTCQQSVDMSKSLDFRLSQGSVAIYCRRGGNLCDMYIENFLWITWWKYFENRSTFASYYQT